MFPLYTVAIRTIYSNQIYHILAGKILNGDFVLDLIKPVNPNQILLTLKRTYTRSR